MKMNRGPRQPARDPVCLSAASGGRGSCFRSAARAYAARTRACFSLVGKAGKSTPEPAALDSLAHRPEGDTLCFVLFTLRSGRLVILRGALGRQWAKRLRIRSIGRYRCCAESSCVYHWRTSILRSSGGGCGPIPEAAQQRPATDRPRG